MKLLRSNSAPLVALAALAASGCAADAVELLVPADVEVHWDASFDEIEDGLVAAIPIDVMVYHVDSGEPVEWAAIALAVDAPGALAMPSGALEVIEPHAEDLDVVWDAYRDLYFAAELESAGNPLYLETDVHGLARAYLYLDVMSRDEAGFAPVQVTASLEDTGEIESFYVVPR